MNDTAPQSAGFNQPRYWLWWLLATIVGWSIGYLADLIIVSVFRLNVEQPAPGNDASQVMGALLSLLIFGLAIGALQWLVLRRQIPHSARWIAATAIGFALGTWFGIAFMGLGVGLAQWWTIRQLFTKGTWWPTVNAVVWPLGYTVGGSLGGLMAASIPSPLWTGLISASLSGVVIGGVTGAVLLWILREERLGNAGPATR